MDNFCQLFESDTGSDKFSPCEMDLLKYWVVLVIVIENLNW